MWLKSKWVVLWSLWAARLVPQPSPVVRASGGLVRGTVSIDGTHVSYYGIPYATVEKRFQAAKLHPKWEGVLDATRKNVRCTQRFSQNMIAGEEDCLIMNIYAPLQISKKVPVMVFIHGGGFRDGSASPLLYGPEYLISHKVLLITFNYRLEILGFLCLGIKEAPGNAGLKDQVEALKWIKENILQFGGDPDNVTIFGESAGSASVFYHLLSPLSKGLFNKAIMQSGSAMSPWALQFDPLDTASKLAREMGYKTQDPQELYNIFTTKSAKKLLSTRIPRNKGDVVLSENVFVPCIETKIDNEEPFLTDTPYNLVIKGKLNVVPLIIGHNSAEGYMFLGKENETTLSQLDFYKALPRDLVFSNEETKLEIAKNLQKKYMNNEEISNKTKLANFEGDSGITYPVVATIDLLIKSYKSPIFAYKISYDGWLNIVKMFFGFGKAPGATHADELFYMFKPSIVLPQAFFEKHFIAQITKMWTNFAKFGDPTPEVTPLLPTKWRPTDKKDPRLLVIDKQFSTAPLWDNEQILFWNSTYTKYRRKY